MSNILVKLNIITNYTFLYAFLQSYLYLYLYIFILKISEIIIVPFLSNFNKKKFFFSSIADVSEKKLKKDEESPLFLSFLRNS